MSETKKQFDSDPEYQQFVADQAKECHCSSRYAPCDGVLAGGMCDDMQDDDKYSCFFCSDPECHNECIKDCHDED